MNESTTTPQPSTPASGAEQRPQAAAGQEARLEKVRKVYVRDLEEGERVHTVFLVTRKARNVGRSGKAYLSLVLSDKTGDVDGRIFDGLEQLESSFAAGDFVLLQGEVISFHGKPQILVSAIERLDPEPIDRKEFTAPPAQHDAKRSVAQLREAAGRVHDPHLKALLLAFLEDPLIVEGLERPAAKASPPAQRATIGEHLLSVMRLAQRAADHYPMVDRELLAAGALLHDIAKVREGAADKRSSESLDEARLVGHPVMTAQAIHEKASQIPGFPRALEHHLIHLVLSYLGSPERGAARLPMTLEALVLQSIVQLDSEVSAWLELMGRDPNEKWTEPSKTLHRQLWKGVIPTVRNKGPVEAKPRRRNGAEKRRGTASAPSAAETQVAAHEEHREQSLPKELVFKPLSEIVPESESPAPAEEAPGTPGS